MPEAFNFGNRLIDHCLREVLQLSGEEFTVNAYRRFRPDEVDEINRCDFVVLPGCTLIQRREHPGMEDLSGVRPPMFCFGGAFFTRLFFPSPKYCRWLVGPIGSRDPFTHGFLRLYGIGSELIGCPTLFSGAATSWKAASGGPVVFNLGRYHEPAQIKVLEEVRKRFPVRAIVQEERQRRAFPAGTEFVDFDDVPGVLRAYAEASVVVTGRLHAALPAIANGTPVVFSQRVWDSRVSLLSHLGLKIRSPFDPALAALTAAYAEGRDRPDERIFGRVRELKESFLSYVERFRRQVGLNGETAYADMSRRPV